MVAKTTRLTEMQRMLKQLGFEPYDGNDPDNKLGPKTVSALRVALEKGLDAIGDPLSLEKRHQLQALLDSWQAAGTMPNALRGLKLDVPQDTAPKEERARNLEALGQLMGLSNLQGQRDPKSLAFKALSPESLQLLKSAMSHDADPDAAKQAMKSFLDGLRKSRPSIRKDYELLSAFPAKVVESISQRMDQLSQPPPSSSSRATTSSMSSEAAPAKPTSRFLPTEDSVAQEAIRTALRFIKNQTLTVGSLVRPTMFQVEPSFIPRTIEKDELGMAHVRMDRTHEDVKVFGEQVICHLDSEGKVKSLTGKMNNIPKGLGTKELKLSPAAALKVAEDDFTIGGHSAFRGAQSYFSRHSRTLPKRLPHRAQ